MGSASLAASTVRTISRYHVVVCMYKQEAENPRYEERKQLGMSVDSSRESLEEGESRVEEKVAHER